MRTKSSTPELPAPQGGFDAAIPSDVSPVGRGGAHGDRPRRQPRGNREPLRAVRSLGLGDQGDQGTGSPVGPARAPLGG